MNIKKIGLFLLLLVCSVVLFACNDKNESGYETPQTDALKLSYDYSNSNFVSQGLGKVELFKVVDGDTIHFRENGEIIKLRFKCVNTPESTGSIDPWGKAASNFVKEVCKNAYEFVLEGEGRVGEPATTDNNGRYLGYVWYRLTKNDDLRMLNLELIENCYSYYTNSSEKYDFYFKNAYETCRETGKRIFGEKDPDFNYDTEIKEISIAQLKENFGGYSTGNRLKLSNVVVVRVVGSSVYLRDVESSKGEDDVELSPAGIYCYHAFKTAFTNAQIGDIISFECQATYSEDYGYQLTNPKNKRTISQGNDVSPIEIPNDVTSLEGYEGEVVKVSNVKVTKIGNESESGAFTIYCTMENGSELLLRISADVNDGPGRTYFAVNGVYNVIGGVSRYNDSYDSILYFQVILCNGSSTNGDIVKNK